MSTAARLGRAWQRTVIYDNINDGEPGSYKLKGTRLSEEAHVTLGGSECQVRIAKPFELG
jgi:hypothetical protein